MTARPLDPLLDTAPGGFLSFDDAGTVLLANTTLAELVGTSRAAIEGAHIDRLLSGAGRIFFSTHLFPLLRLHGRAEELYVPLRRADGSDLPMLVNGVARDRDGAAAYDLVLVPMRQRNELESELIAARNAALEASSAKDRFLSVVSHELRTPLTAVRGYADLMLRGREPLTERQRGYVTRISDAAQYQVGLIEEILDFASLERRRAVGRERLEVEQLIARAVSVLSIRAAEDDHGLRREPAAAEGAVIGDARAVQQILLNLGINAIKFSPTGSEIVIGSDADRDRARITIRDFGPGVPEADRERIFEAFTQLQPTEDAAGPVRGVGLGLAISRDLARSMGGDIIVGAPAGGGSTFTLELPSAGV